MIVFFFLFAFSLGLLYQIYMEENFQIYNRTLRFHVRAASDLREEQQLKLQVRDAVLDFLQETVGRAEDSQNLEKDLSGKLTEIQKIAENTLQCAGSSRKVCVSLKNERFPIRRYGPVVFPAGEYSALRVDIGNACGHNWWCAIYPELCYQGENTMELSDKGEKDLNKNLSEKEKNTIAGKKVKMRFKILEWISKW